MWTLNDFKPIYQEFLGSGKTVRQFCADAEIHEGRFYHWQNKLRQEVANGLNGEFLPVSINNRGGKVTLVGGDGRPMSHTRIQPPTCEITFPNGVTVRLSGNNPLEAISGLIMLPR